MNSPANNLWVVIAAYNESKVVKNVISEVLSCCPNVVVVDDGSSDDTYTELLDSDAWVLRHPINLGQGAALQTGISFALSKGAEYIATFDADGQHSISDLLAMHQRISSEGFDVILGSRFLGNAVNISPFRKFFLKAAAAYTGLISGMWLTDAHNGLRIFSAQAARKINIQQNRMSHASEIVDLISENRLSYKEHPVTITYTDYSKQKGQKLSNSVAIVIEQLISRFMR